MEKRTRGRPTVYKEEYCDHIRNYFNVPLTQEILKESVSNKGDVVQIKETICNAMPMFNMW